jgi:asparaginyl-tRNA synthetase
MIVDIEHIGRYEDRDVTIQGWLYNKRSSGKIRFLLVRDGTGTIQCVVSQKEVDDATFEATDRLTQESSLVIEGVVRADERSPIGYELTVKRLEIVSVSEPFPITKKEHETAFLMDNRHLWLRSSKQHAILKVRHEVIRAIREFFDDRGFVLIDAPILTPNACEGTTTLFETSYFDKKAYLSQSGQLYMEAACMAFKRVYCFGPTFRAEKSKTRRHLIEFWMVEPEVAFATLDDIMELEEGVTLHVLDRVLGRRERELVELGRDVELLKSIKGPFPRYTYTEVVEMLGKLGKLLKWGEDLGGDEETVFTQEFKTPVFVHHYPAAGVGFYIEPDPEDDKLSQSVDLLAPEGYGEIIGGGSLRISSLELLERRIKEHGLPREMFEWYLDLRRYGSVPHGGFGIGVERLIRWVCGREHIRETIPFPRLLGRMYP